MFRIFNGATADEVWQSIAAEFRQGAGTSQGSRAGETQEILHAGITITNPRERWVTSRYPPINPAFALAEVVWILAGRNDSKFLNYFNSKLPGFAGQGPIYHGAYGYRLRKHFAVDQLARAYQALRKNPSSRQVVLQIWDVTMDLPKINGTPSSQDIPCNIVSLLKVRNGALEWNQIIRSNDLYRGVPYNFVQFTSLQEILAGWLGIKLGSYHQVSDSLHVYQTDLDDVLGSKPIPRVSNTDTISLQKAPSERAFLEISATMDDVLDLRLKSPQMVKMLNRSQLPTGFHNILAVLFAEAARRRQHYDEMETIISSCSNPAFRMLFNRWRSALDQAGAVRVR